MSITRLAIGFIVLILVLAACSQDAPTPPPDIDATARVAMERTVTTQPALIPIPTIAPVSTPTPWPTPTPTVPTLILRPLSEWTAQEPATFEEIEAELLNYRGRSLDVLSWGGAYGAAPRQAYFLPFQEKFNIQIAEHHVHYRGQTFDVIDLSARQVYLNGHTGDLEELTPAIHNRYLSDFPQAVITPWSGGGGVLWSTGLAYQKSKIDELWGGKKPEDWTAFWDVENFPGTRWMGRRVNENIFFAQFNRTPEILDSVEGRTSIAKLTEEQVDQSFEELQKIKPHIQFWWNAGADCPTALLNDEADMCTAWNDRIRDVLLEPGGDNIHYCFECGYVNQTGVFAIMKESTNKTLAELFISWTAEPHINVDMVNYIPFRPLNRQALSLIPEDLPADLVATLPTSPTALTKAVLVDEDWLGANLNRLNERMYELLADY